MPPKNTLPSKQVVKKDTKKAPLASAEFSDPVYETLSKRIGEVCDRTSKKKLVKRGKKTTKNKGKKAVPQDSESPPKGPKRKNPIISPPHTTSGYPHLEAHSRHVVPWITPSDLRPLMNLGALPQTRGPELLYVELAQNYPHPHSYHYHHSIVENIKSWFLAQTWAANLHDVNVVTLWCNSSNVVVPVEERLGVKAIFTLMVSRSMRS
ncbi:hypothetical protein FXO38_02362 [Capsicum annuum]|nr:hypothetical protein FXO38_02362 [Capsicum annuum]